MPSQTKRQLYIKTWGCQMNEYDSERIGELLTQHGYQLCDDEQNADLVILNTCHIREKASEKLYSQIGRIQANRQAKKTSKKTQRLAIGGCVAQAEGHAVISRAPYVDLVFGPQSYHRLPEFLAKLDRGVAKNLVATDFPEEDKFDYLPERQIGDRQAGPKKHPRQINAFLTIQEGCDKFCSFCVVPYTRGAELSRSLETIVNEAKKIVGQGVCEITLLGQNVNAWSGKNKKGQSCSFADLLFHISNIKGLKRLSYTTSHPADMNDDLIFAHRDLKPLIPWLHLPVQSGSDKILKAMNRHYSCEQYLDIIAKLRKHRPDMAFSSDFIVGFPGETDEDFAKTIALIRKVEYANSYSFIYSSRPGTPASILENQIDRQKAQTRLQTLQQLLSAQQQSFNQKMIGKTIHVLIEKQGQNPLQIRAKSPWMQPVHFDYHADETPPNFGEIVALKIDKVKGHSLFGTRI
ncbi:MAG: tRNA (N6-isopentenyl adenosine(37)-C2)-methylthiotransferase MiaB [Pseudomonadota bacterium]